MANVTGPVETASFEVSIKNEEGYEAKITVEYPKDRANIALAALVEVAKDKYLTGLIAALKEDASIKQFLEDNNLGVEDDPER